jgi:hypothetical protein
VLRLSPVVTWIVLLLWPAAAPAQQNDCMLICSPTLRLGPGLSVSNVFGQPEVRKLSTGEVRELPKAGNFLMTLTAETPTEIPRTSLIFSLQWTPFADTDANAYTGYTADEMDEEEVNANSLTLQAGPSFRLLSFEQTKGIYATNVSVLDLISPAAEPDDARNFTHKLLLEWEGCG